MLSSGQEYKRKQLEEQRQAERLQRQLQQERDYLVSLQQQQQQQRQDQRPAEKKPLYHYKEGINASEKPAWAKEVGKSEERGGAGVSMRGSLLERFSHSGHTRKEPRRFLSLLCLLQRGQLPASAERSCAGVPC